MEKGKRKLEEDSNNEAKLIDKKGGQLCVICEQSPGNNSVQARPNFPGIKHSSSERRYEKQLCHLKCYNQQYRLLQVKKHKRILLKILFFITNNFEEPKFEFFLFFLIFSCMRHPFFFSLFFLCLFFFFSKFFLFFLLKQKTKNKNINVNKK